MPQPTNAYTRAISDLPQKILGYIDHLDKTGQVDHDSNGDPLVLSYEKDGSGYRVKIARNGYEENFFSNHRKRAGEDGILRPIKKSWDSSDGWTRKSSEKVKVSSDLSGSRGERAMKPVSEEAYMDYESVVEGIIVGS